MTVKDAMRALGVFAMREPTPDKVQTVFRRLCLRHHPDKGGDRAKLERVVEARRVALSSWDAVAALHRQHWEKKAQAEAVRGDSVASRVARTVIDMSAFDSLFTDARAEKEEQL